MNAPRPGLDSIRVRLGVALLTLALFCRILVPAGFMPTPGEGFAITICSDGAAMPGWVDRQGVVHKGEHAPAKGPDHPCAFAGFGAALDSPPTGAKALAEPVHIATPTLRPIHTVSVGRGLAAPPPPATGPPAFA